VVLDFMTLHQLPPLVVYR